MADDTPNPWTYAGWNLTQQGEIVKRIGLLGAERWAKAAGTTIGGPRPPNPDGPKHIETRVFVMHGRKGGDGGGVGGKGYSGDGPPGEDV